MGRRFAKVLATEQGLQSNREFAEVLGINPKVLSQYLSGRRLPRRPRVAAMQEVLGITDGRLLSAWLDDDTNLPATPGKLRGVEKLTSSQVAAVQAVINELIAEEE